MKLVIPEGRDTDTPYKRFEKVAKALMAVPKKELDKETAKDGRKNQTKRKVSERKP